MRPRSLLPTVALLFALPALARENPAPLPAPPAPTAAQTVQDTVRKVYSVADLVVPIPSANGTKQAGAYQKNAEALVRVVTGTVRPQTWAENGGAGRIEFHETNYALVVHNTPAAVAEVGELLDTMRRLQGPQLVYELRLLKVPAGFCDRVGLKLTGDAVLTDDTLRTLLEAVEGQREACVMQAPKVTAFDGQSFTVRTGEERVFATGADVVKVQGNNVFVPKNTSVYLGDVITLSGTAAADNKSVRLKAQVARTALAGDVELVPVVTQITPIFEGGSQGKPVPFTQYLQAPDVRTYKIDRTVTVPANGTVVLGSWKEPATAKPAKVAPKTVAPKDKPAGECEVVVLVTARVLRAADEQPAAEARVYKLKNVAAVDAAQALTEFARAKKQNVVIVAEAVTNCVCVSGTAEAQKQVADIVAALDKAPQQVLVQALVIDVPDGFAAKCGLTEDARAGAWVLTPRETQMFGAFLRTAKERGELDVLSRPQIQVADNQTGFVQVGQQYPVTAAGGKVEVKQLGLTMRVTPRLAPDGKSVLLNTEMQNTAVGTSPVVKTAFIPGTVFPVTALAPVPVFNTHEVKGATVVPFGNTAVFAGGTEARVGTSVNTAGVRSPSTEKRQTYVVLTPHLVASPAEVKPAAGWFTK